MSLDVVGIRLSVGCGAIISRMEDELSRPDMGDLLFERKNVRLVELTVTVVSGHLSAVPSGADDPFAEDEVRRQHVPQKE